MQMIVRFLATTTGNRILGCFQLHNHAGKTLRERVMNVTRHSVSFFENRSPPALLGKLIESKRQHDLVGEGLGQLDLLRSIRRTIDMANANKASDLSTHHQRHGEKPLCAVSFQMLTPIAGNTRISLDVIATHRTGREKQLLNYCVLFPELGGLNEWMLRIPRDQFSAIRR